MKITTEEKIELYKALQAETRKSAENSIREILCTFGTYEITFDEDEMMYVSVDGDLTREDHLHSEVSGIFMSGGEVIVNTEDGLVRLANLTTDEIVNIYETVVTGVTELLDNWFDQIYEYDLARMFGISFENVPDVGDYCQVVWSGMDLTEKCQMFSDYGGEEL